MFLDWSLHDLNDLLYVDPPGGSRNPKEIPVEIHTNGCECTEYHLKDKYVTVSIGKMAFRWENNALYAHNGRATSTSC